MPVRDDCFESSKAGKAKESEIRGEDIVPFLRNQELKVYPMSIAIDLVIRNASQGSYKEPFERLMSALMNKLYHHALNYGIRVTEIVSVGWTGPGRKRCKELGMQTVGQDADGNPIYWVDLASKKHQPAERILPGVQRLLDTYKNLAETVEA